MSTEPHPVVRARFCQEWLVLVESEAEPGRSRFMAKVDGPTRTAIESASRVAWIPIDYHVKLADILQESFGAVHAHDYYRRVFAGSLTGPVLGPLMRTGARVLGVSMHTFVRWASKGWEAAFRNAGELSGEILGPERARIHYKGLPAVCLASDGWMLSGQGTTYGAYDILGIKGVVRVDLSGRSEGRMVLDLEWIQPP